MEVGTELFHYDGRAGDEVEGPSYGFRESRVIEDLRAAHFGEIQGTDLGSGCVYFMLKLCF